jgi:hypothetical protein
MIKALPRPLAGLAEDLADGIRVSTTPVAPRRLLGPGVVRLTAARRRGADAGASIPALSHVVECLGFDAERVVFDTCIGSGPLQGDLETRWQGRRRPRLLNTGS